jgi:hypothetical protein
MIQVSDETMLWIIVWLAIAWGIISIINYYWPPR